MNISLISAAGVLGLVLFVFVFLRWVVCIVLGRPCLSIIQLKIDPDQLEELKVLVCKSKGE